MVVVVIVVVVIDSSRIEVVVIQSSRRHSLQTLGSKAGMLAISNAGMLTKIVAVVIARSIVGVLIVAALIVKVL